MYEERRRKKRRKHTPKLARRLSPLISAGIYQIRLSGEGGKHEALFYHFFIPSFGGCCYCYFSDDRRKSVKNTYFDFCRKWNGWEKKKFPSNDMRRDTAACKFEELSKKSPGTWWFSKSQRKVIENLLHRVWVVWVKVCGTFTKGWKVAEKRDFLHKLFFSFTHLGFYCKTKGEPKKNDSYWI